MSKADSARLEHLLPTSGPLELLILRGHLLLEEALTELISTRCYRPDILLDCQLSFFQKLKLVQALHSVVGLMEPDVVFLKAFNRVRNILAHTVEPRDIESRIDTLLRQYYSEEPTTITSDLDRFALLRELLLQLVSEKKLRAQHFKGIRG
jgi:hypothetical protein